MYKFEDFRCGSGYGGYAVVKQEDVYLCTDGVLRNWYSMVQQLDSAYVKALTNLGSPELAKEAVRKFIKNQKGNKMSERLEQVKKDIALLKEEEARLIKEAERKRAAQGDMFICDGDEYILAYMGKDKLALVSMNTGGHWRPPVSVQSHCCLTSAEYDAIFGTLYKFERKVR